MNQRWQIDVESTWISRWPTSRRYFNIYIRWINVECLLGNVSPNILAKNENFKELRHDFVYRRAVIITTFPVTEKPLHLFAFKRKDLKTHFNSNSELSENSTEKQIMLFKTTLSWLFNDMWCYLMIGCFDWKNGIFQQTSVRVCCILKWWMD